MDTIRIEGLEIDCIVGLRPHERRRRQPVRIDLALGLDLSVAGQSGRIGHTADYSRVADEVTLLLRFREYQLIEMATEELCAMLLGLHPMLERVEIRLEKPSALRGRARGASVEVRRDRAQLPRREELAPYGLHEYLLETHEARLSLLRVAPGQKLPIDAGDAKRQVEWLVAGELVRGGVALSTCDAIVWPRGRLEPYANLTEEPATLFSCTCLGPEASAASDC
jgi:dihydroneopterin aldolase